MKDITRRQFLKYSGAVPFMLAPLGLVNTVHAGIKGNNVTEAEYSYYDPVAQTTRNIVLGRPSQDPLLVGEDLEKGIVVACELGRYIIKIYPNGTRHWYIDYPKFWSRSITTDGTYLYLALGTKFRILEIETGYTYAEKELGRKINFINFYEGDLIIGFEGFGSHNIKVYDFDSYSLVLTERYSCAERTNNPRHAIKDGRYLIVADTFNHRMFKWDLINNTTIYEKGCYYPNSVFKEAPAQYGVVIEHENKITVWNETMLTWNYVFGSNISTFASAEPDPDIETNELSTGIRIGAYNRSLADMRIAGENTLYSPNFSAKVGNKHFICDTDNHRIVVVEDAVIKSTLYGFNSPTSLCIS